MIKKFTNGFAYIEVSNKTARAKIALQGAHIFEYKCQDKKEILWLSPTSDFELGKAIRGGIPICWPRFGILDKSMPAHGFSRTALFELVSIKELDAGSTEVTLRLRDTAQTREIWDYKFELNVVFTISDTLSVEIITKNRDTKEFMITEALHSYFSVSEIEDVVISGLDGKSYIDTLSDKSIVQADSVTINAETDRVYLNVAKEIILEDKQKRVLLDTVGAHSAIIWNPWIEKGAKMSGMQKRAYKEFVCIESGNAFENFRVLKAGESHTLGVTLSIG